MRNTAQRQWRPRRIGLVGTSLGVVLAAGLWAGAGIGAGAAAEQSSDAPVAVFAELDGTWQGTFVGWDAAGPELYRLSVRQTYRTVDDHTQRVEIEDRMPDGSVVTGRGVNTAHRNPDGSLELRCRVTKSNGERVEHEGRVVRGPDGAEELVWHSGGDGRWETFRERVRREGDTEVYEIDGLGRYGDQVVVMAGRYYRVEVDRGGR